MITNITQLPGHANMQGHATAKRRAKTQGHTNTERHAIILGHVNTERHSVLLGHTRNANTMRHVNKGTC